MNRRVAILIINYNNEVDTFRCLESLFNSKYKKIKIYLLDNSSKIFPKKEFENFMRKRKLIGKIIESKINTGFAEGNNILIKEALKDEKNEYFFVLNNDTTVKKNCISELIKTVEENCVGAVQPKIRIGTKPAFIQEGGANKFNYLVTGKKKFFRCPEKEFPKKEFESDILCGCGMLIKREILKKIYPWFKKEYFLYFEDIDFSLRIRKNGYRLIINPLAEILHWESSSTKKISGLATYYFQRNGIVVRKENANSFASLTRLLAIFLASGSLSERDV